MPEDTDRPPASPAAEDEHAPTDAPGEDEAPDDGNAENMRQQLSRVYHDLNNSLAVISGNAQLLSEMARAEGLGTAFTDPLDDVEAARSEISDALSRLDRLREAADRRLDAEEEAA